MAWEISMSAGGWAQVQANIERLAETAQGRDVLARAIANDAHARASRKRRGDDEISDLDVADEAYAYAYDQALDLSSVDLADFVFSQVVQHNTSTNGGFEVWADEMGLVTIPVDPIPGAEVVEL